MTKIAFNKIGKNKAIIAKASTQAITSEIAFRYRNYVDIIQIIHITLQNIVTAAAKLQNHKITCNCKINQEAILNYTRTLFTSAVALTPCLGSTEAALHVESSQNICSKSIINSL